MQVRLLERDDRERLERFGDHLSRQTVYRRFLGPLPKTAGPILDRLVDLDHWDREALAAVADGEIVAVARYMRGPGAETAELAVVVADEWQGRGLGRLLLRRLAALARSRCISAFTGTMLGDNRPMLELLRSVSPRLRARWEGGGQLEVEIPLR